MRRGSKINWHREALASADPEFGDSAWFIGRDRKWYVPATSGAVNTYSKINWQIRVDNLPIKIGTSGAPLLIDDGIAGMIIGSDSSVNEAIALSVSAIQMAFEEWQLPWALTKNEIK